MHCFPPREPASLHDAITHSSNRLFFVKYHPQGVLRAQWYLVTVDLEQSLRIRSTPGQYYVHFLCRHPNDSSESDADARWWPEWHEYTESNNIIDYGRQVLVYPGACPDATKYIAWADVVNLTDPNTSLLGPFDFQDESVNPPSRSPSFRQYVPTDIWQQLHRLCVATGTQPPILSMPSPAQPQQSTRTTRSRKRPRSDA